MAEVWMSFLQALQGMGGNELSPNAVPVSGFCAVLGSLILMAFTRDLGVFTFIFYVVVLFAGAISANLLLSGLDLNLSPMIERPLVLSIGGIAVSALIVLAAGAERSPGA